jgi:hypothetical protein
MCLYTSKNLESKNAVYFGDLPKYKIPAPCHWRLHAISLPPEITCNFPAVDEFSCKGICTILSNASEQLRSLCTSVFAQWKAKYEVSYTISYPFVKVFEKWITVTCLGHAR